MKTKKVVNQSRCESCLELFNSAELDDFDGDVLCRSCGEIRSRPPIDPNAKQWYCVAVYANDMKARTAILQKCRNKGMSSKIGKIIIPKVKASKTTLPSWEVVTNEGKVVGRVSALDHEEALYKAKNMYGRPKKTKGVYKPVAIPEDSFLKVEKVKEGRRIIYHAISTTGRLLGKLTERTEKKALTTATRLYGDPKIDTNPRTPKLIHYDIAEVRMVKNGGRVMEQNLRAMPGYILAELENNELLFATVKSARGVGTILPYTEPMTYEDLKKGEVPPIPTPIPNEEVEILKESIPMRQSSVEFKVGDKVRVVEGPFTGMDTEVKSVFGSVELPKVKVEVGIISMKTVVELLCSQIRKM